MIMLLGFAVLLLAYLVPVLVGRDYCPHGDIRSQCEQCCDDYLNWGHQP